MPEVVEFTFASEAPMHGFFGPLILRVNRDSVDLHRIDAASKMALLPDHWGDTPIGKITSARVENGFGYATAETVETLRSAPYLDEMRKGLRSGISPGFILLKVSFEEADDGDEVTTVVEEFEIYEMSCTPIPRMSDIGISRITKTNAKRASQASVNAPTAAPAAAPASTPVAAVRAWIDREQRLTEREAAMARQELRLDQRIGELARTESGRETPESAPLDLAGVVTGLVQLAQNPSAPTPSMPGVKVESLQVGGLSAKVPTLTLALTSATTPTINTSEPGAVQPDLSADGAILALCRPVRPAYGSFAMPTLTSAPSSGMISEGAGPIALADPGFANPAPSLSMHQAQVRASITLEALISGGSVLSSLLDESLSAELRSLMTAQLLTGTGAGANVRGLVNIPGVGTSSYAATNRASAASFRDAENVLEAASVGPETRRAWILASSLYRAARETVRSPGNGEFVVERRRVLGEHRAFKTTDLGDNIGLFCEWSQVILAEWPQVDIVVDTVSQPGEPRLTVIHHFDTTVLRPAAVVKMDQV